VSVSVKESEREEERRREKESEKEKATRLATTGWAGWKNESAGNDGMQMRSFFVSLELA